MELHVKRELTEGKRGQTQFEVSAQVVLTPDEAALVGRFNAWNVIFEHGETAESARSLGNGFRSAYGDITLALDRERDCVDGARQVATLLATLSTWKGEQVYKFVEKEAAVGHLAHFEDKEDT